MKNLFLYLSLSLIIITIVSCVEPFETNYNIAKKVLYVDATLTDLAQKQFVTIKEAIPSYNTAYYEGVRKADVKIIVDENTKISLTEKEAGIYYLPDSFSIEKGRKYKLAFSTQEGKNYESSIETLIYTSPITKIYQKLELQGIETATGYNPAHYIYIDTQDPAEDQNYYVWTWKLWEKQRYCVSCEGGKYYTNPEPTGKCVEDARLKRAGTVYDYQCDSQCWDILYNTDLNVMSDAFSNGQEIKGRLVAKIPYYQLNNALIEINQQSVSPSAYRYLKLLVSQSQNTGSLADTPPAPLVGNIKCLNSDESVGGYFMISSIKTIRHWINRDDINALKMKPLGLLNGRDVNPEPSGTDTTRPPMAHCLESRTRTAKMPYGWLE